tara:strand:+ start:3171 stop:3893 length:723 start_codon:yes stop_codon:yes gene_type:complete
MKKLIFLFLCFISLSTTALAEYNGWFIQFKLVTKDQQHLTGHIYVASAYIDLDSLQYTDYVAQKFDRLDYNYNDTIRFFKHRIAYHYTPYMSQDTATIYTLTEEQFVAVDQVESITIEEKISFGYLMDIATEHAYADRKWMQQPPVQTAHDGGYLCDWQIFIHERNAQTDAILKELETLDKKLKAEMQELEEILNYEGRDDYFEAQEKAQALENSIDEQKQKILEKFQGQKVVIVAFCSC